MCDTLVNRVPALFADSTGALLDSRVSVLKRNDGVSLDRGNYKLVLYWDKADWTKHKTANGGTSDGSAPGPHGSTRAAKGINVSLLYVQKEDGLGRRRDRRLPCRRHI